MVKEKAIKTVLCWQGGFRENLNLVANIANQRLKFSIVCNLSRKSMLPEVVPYYLIARGIR